MPREVNQTQPYQDKVVKLVPTEIVGAYILLSGIIPVTASKILIAAVAIVLLALTPFYLIKISKVNNTPQIVVTTISFGVWVYSLGGPFAAMGIYQPYLASIVMILWTLIIPLLVPAND